MSKGPPILVTGSHRSGSTWVGRTIARSPDVFYVSEPFNPHSSPGICDVNRSRWFLYVCPENEALHAPAIDRMMALRYNVVQQLSHAPNLAGLRRLGRDLFEFSLARIERKRVLLKDPIALFSAEWLAQRYGMSVVALIRHPAAFVSSLKRVNWQFEYENFVAQPALMRDLLAPFDAEIRAFAAHRPSLTDAAVLQWRIMHHVLARYEQTHESWMFARHEDLSRDPIAGFRNIYTRLGLDFSADIEGWLERTTAPGNAVEAEEGVEHMLVRDSRAVVKSWKKRFTELELVELRNAVESISSRWYGDEDW